LRISATPIVNVNKLIIKSWKHVAYILLIIFLSAEFDVNVARGKPTFASSVYCDGPGPSCRLSQFAVDGSYTTLSNDYFCFTSSNDSRPKLTEIVIVIFKLLKRHSKAKRRTPALGKSFTRSCMWSFGVKLPHSIRAVSGAPLSSSGLEEAL